MLHDLRFLIRLFSARNHSLFLARYFSTCAVLITSMVICSFGNVPTIVKCNSLEEIKRKPGLMGPASLVKSVVSSWDDDHKPASFLCHRPSLVTKGSDLVRIQFLPYLN